MSSTTHNLPYTRFTRQVRTEPQALLATDVAAANALTMLKSADWVQRADETDVTFPARSAVQDGFNPLWDAFKHVGNYSAGYQRAYAGMVAYRFQVPADALTGPTDLTSIAVPLNVDRWLVDGVRVAAYASDSAVPSADWDTLRTGDVNLEGQLPMTYTEDDPPQRIVVEKSDTLTLTFPGSTASKKYLYVVVSLEDYATTRGFWIEGASLIQGQNTVTTFDASVAADVQPPIDQQYAGEFSVMNNGGSGSNDRYAYTEDLAPNVDPASAASSRVLIERALSVMDTNQAVGGTGTGVGISFVESGSNTLMRVTRRVTTSWFRPSTNRTLTKLRFRSYSIPFASTPLPVHLRTIVYFVPAFYVPFTSGSDGRVGYDATDASVADSNIARRAFWHGEATEIEFWDDEAGVTLGSHTAVRLLDIINTKPIPADPVWYNISQPVTAEGTIVVASTPHRLAGALTGNTTINTYHLVELI